MILSGLLRFRNKIMAAAMAIAEIDKTGNKSLYIQINWIPVAIIQNLGHRV